MFYFPYIVNWNCKYFSDYNAFTFEHNHFLIDRTIRKYVHFSDNWFKDFALEVHWTKVHDFGVEYVFKNISYEFILLSSYCVKEITICKYFKIQFNFPVYCGDVNNIKRENSVRVRWTDDWDFDVNAFIGMSSLSVSVSIVRRCRRFRLMKLKVSGITLIWTMWFWLDVFWFTQNL